MELNSPVNHLYYSANDKKLKRFNLFVMMFFEILRIFKFTQKNACFLLSNFFSVVGNQEEENVNIIYTLIFLSTVSFKNFFTLNTH